LVDDDRLVTATLVRVLEARGFVTRVVPDVSSAKHALEAAEFDVVLLDLYLPDGDGMDVLRITLDRALAPPVLLMTGRAEIRGAVEAIRQGAADYIEKPFDMGDLLVRIDRALEAAKTKRKLALYEEKDRRATCSPAAPSKTSSSWRHVWRSRRRPPRSSSERAASAKRSSRRTSTRPATGAPPPS
jgi:DNA-binding NtrC family response regulator